MYKILSLFLLLALAYTDKSYGSHNENIKVLHERDIKKIGDGMRGDAFSINQSIVNSLYEQCENQVLTNENTKLIFEELKNELKNNSHRSFKGRTKSKDNKNDFKTQIDQNAIAFGELPNIKSKEIQKLSKELNKAYQLQGLFFSLLQNLPKDNKVHELFNGLYPSIDLAMYVVPSYRNVLEKNKDYLLRKSNDSRPHVKASIIYPSFFFTPSKKDSVPPHYDLPDVIFKDGRDILAFNVGITDFNYNTSPLFIYDVRADLKDYSDLLLKENIDTWRKGMASILGKKSMSDYDLAKIVACLKSNQQHNNKNYHPLQNIMLGANSYCKSFAHDDSKIRYAEGKPGQGFFFRPYSQCHSSVLKNISSQSRETLSIRMMTENDVKDSSKGWIDFEDKNNKNKELLKIIFGLKESDVKNLSSAYCSSNMKNKYCTTKQDLEQFFNLDKVKEFFNTPLEDSINQIKLRIENSYS